MLKIRTFFFTACFLAFSSLSLFGFPILKTLNLQFGDWEKISPGLINGSQGNQHKAYRSIQFFLKTKKFAGIDLKAGVPFSFVSQGDQDNSLKARMGFTDISLQPSFHWKQLSFKLGWAFPLGYSTHVDSVWLGSGSIQFKPELEYYFNNPDQQVVGGIALGYKNYMEDSKLGWGSWEVFFKNYWIKKWVFISVGAELLAVRKSLSFKFGSRVSGWFREVYGVPIESLEVIGGFFLSKRLSRQFRLLGGAKLTLIRVNAPPAVSSWLQLGWIL